MVRNATPLMPIEDPSAGAKLKAAMDGAGVTVAELSRRTGLSSRTISALRSGKSIGNFATWRAVARALGKSVEEVTE